LELLLNLFVGTVGAAPDPDIPPSRESYGVRSTGSSYRYRNQASMTLSCSSGLRSLTWQGLIGVCFDQRVLDFATLKLLHGSHGTASNDGGRILADYDIIAMT